MIQSSTSGVVMARLKERRDADKYRSLGQPIHLTGIEFSGQKRSVLSFEAESV